MYRRSALGSARFHTPKDTTSHHCLAIPDSHRGFEPVGLDDTALTQVSFFSACVCYILIVSVILAERNIPPARPNESVWFMAGQVQAPGCCRALSIRHIFPYRARISALVLRSQVHSHSDTRLPPAMSLMDGACDDTLKTA
jgi:hypothetical protein